MRLLAIFLKSRRFEDIRYDMHHITRPEIHPSDPSTYSTAVLNLCLTCDFWYASIQHSQTTTNKVCSVSRMSKTCCVPPGSQLEGHPRSAEWTFFSDSVLKFHQIPNYWGLGFLDSLFLLYIIIHPGLEKNVGTWSIKSHE